MKESTFNGSESSLKPVQCLDTLNPSWFFSHEQNLRFRIFFFYSVPTSVEPIGAPGVNGH